MYPIYKCIKVCFYGNTADNVTVYYIIEREITKIREIKMQLTFFFFYNKPKAFSPADDSAFSSTPLSFDSLFRERKINH
jgi:hypothetical protein